MSRQHHVLKIETEYYQAIERGEKKFELRKNDRDFKKYDMLYLEEVVNGVKTGRRLPPVEIQYVLKDCPKYGLNDGYCILNW
jgi:ParB family transcriptional regulator, chromosome partitioning protein